ncbi:HpcH/HpaI aldolase family protein [Pseudodesulfovibrio tunisiensis]|uniref:HpcH/HpaI aldolase family protein n=1 Tax=Pseudodesulfovibrio tunisiensis TaxID=463192 RepID=UPI001FB3BA91|nr:aldolase/citrate lyase family protein [Pseudodesulfovibrio tunisiensis]
MKSSFRSRLCAGETLTGSWLTIGSTTTAEIMASADFDWLTIDMEHSAIGLGMAQEMIRTVEARGVTPLVRVGHNQPNLIKRVMDAGATGVIVPMVNTAEEAEQAVQSVKYPPRGFRGVGLARAQQYGFGFEEYQQWNHDNSVVIVQVEHIEAVNNLESILAVDGVDGFMVGPYDLSGSLGMPGNFSHPDVKAALERVEAIAAGSRAAPGFHVVQPDPDALEAKRAKGYRFLAYGLDSLFLGAGARKAATEARNPAGQSRG